MMKKIGAALVALFVFAAAMLPARAQFADQATAIQSVAGTNTITGTLPNVVSYADVLNVLVKLTPAPATGNTTAATLNLNSIGPIAINKPTSAGLVALTGTELVAGQPALLMYNGTVFVLLSVTSTTVAVANLANSSLQFGVPVNLQLNASVGSNNLTIAIKGNNGSDPSVTNPVLIPFRDTTIANGDPVIVSLQSALSFTVNSTLSMGCTSGNMCRLWIIAINNAGTVALCAFNALSGTSVAAINEGILWTSNTNNNGSSLAQVLACGTTSVTNKAIRILGYLEISEVTAGTWATGPTFVQLFGPGIKKPGDTVQIVAPAPNTTQTTLLTTQTQTGISATIVPTSAANVIKVSSNVNVLGGSGSNGIVQLSRGTAPTLFGDQGSFTCAVQVCIQPIRGIDSPFTTSSLTYYIFGKSSANNIVVNDIAATYAPSSSIIVEEIMSALEPAANDNEPLRMVG
jgi:hypothetical protein